MNDKELMEYEGLGGWARSFVRKGDFAEYAKLRDAGMPKINAFLEMRKLIWLRVAACTSATGTRARAAWPTDTKTDKIVFEDWPLDMAKAKAWLAAKNAKIAARRSSAPAAAPAAPTPAPTPSVSPTTAPTPMPTVEAIPIVEDIPVVEGSTAPKSKENATDVVKRWQKFFTDCGDFSPQIRFINALAHMASADDAAEYIAGYFSLSNNSFAKVVEDKVKSAEFTALAEDTMKFKPSRRINSRLEVYYGEPGSGKTTRATLDNPDAEVVVCHSGMTADEMFRGFNFVDGKPAFVGSPLQRAMRDGKTVILDEGNLLNLDCQRALQLVTDGKDKVVIGTDEVKIKDGFRVIVTMNLNVGDEVLSLPPPLVDRIGVIKKFKASAATIANAALF